MLKNFFKTAFRNLLRNKLHSFVNIAGLSVGMAIAIIIGLWIWDETSFNKNHTNYDRIAQVIQNVTNNGEVQTWTSIPYPLAEELRQNYGSDFKQVVLGGMHSYHLLGHETKKINLEGIYIEPAAPEMFSLQMKQGSREALNDPTAVLISASTAKTFFGSEDPMNKRMRIDNDIDAIVKGVYEDMPANSTFSKLAFMAPWQMIYTHERWFQTMSDPWRPNSFLLYVQLNPGADLNSVSLKIRDAKLKKVNAQLAKMKPALFLHPMKNWHLRSEFKNGVNTGGRISYVWMFGTIGVFVLLLACINFMNLSTARSEKRAREVGIRKAIGSMRVHLIVRFLGESLFMAGISFALSILLVQLTLPFFNSVAEKSMSVPWTNPAFWAAGIGFSLITALVAGSYPALYLSSFRPVKVLKGTFKAGRWATVPRKALVVTQFTVSVALIIGTITVFRQIEHARNRPVGYDSNGLVSTFIWGNTIHKHFDVVKQELLSQGAIVEMAESASPLTETWMSSSGFKWRGKDPNLSINFSAIGADVNYGKTVGWDIIEGRDFSPKMLTDSFAIILNESAAKYMGFQQPIGEMLDWNGQQLHVIGVVKDMIFRSPYEPVAPIIYYFNEGAGSVVLMKLNPSRPARESLATIEAVFKKTDPEQPFQFEFVEEAYSRKFSAEQKVGKLAGFFALLAVFISCLGIFGLASFVAEQRTKEIGVRKVLGASVFNCWKLLSKDFVWLVFISLLIAIPLGWYFMNNWLQNYEYRANLSWWIFAAAGLGALVITLITVSFQSVKAALMNPVNSLRTE